MPTNRELQERLAKRNAQLSEAARGRLAYMLERNEVQRKLDVAESNLRNQEALDVHLREVALHEANQKTWTSGGRTDSAAIVSVAGTFLKFLQGS